jgi:hypothetical protein
MIAEGIHHDIDFATYLSGTGIPAPAVSGSDLVNYETECPAYAHAFWRGNPARIQSDSTPAMTLGTAAHAYILEGADAFHDRYTIKPEGLNFATREGRAWRDAQEGRSIISFDQHMTILAMRDALMAQPDARRLLEAGGRAEVTMVARDEETGLTLLCRPDLWIGRAGLAVNLKTTSSPAPNAWRRTCANLRYDLGDAMFRLVAGLLGVQRPSHAFMVVGSNAPHLGYVAALSAEAASAADQQLRQILRRFAKSVASNDWPGYTVGVLEIGFPQWAANEIAANIQREYAA